MLWSLIPPNSQTEGTIKSRKTSFHGSVLFLKCFPADVLLLRQHVHCFNVLSSTITSLHLWIRIESADWKCFAPYFERGIRFVMLFITDTVPFKIKKWFGAFSEDSGSLHPSTEGWKIWLFLRYFGDTRIEFHFLQLVKKGAPEKVSGIPKVIFELDLFSKSNIWTIFPSSRTASLGLYCSPR